LGDEYILDLKKNYDIPADWKYDVVPEIWQGHNVADFIDPEIMKRLEELEEEERLREEAGYYDQTVSDEDDETKEVRQLARQIRKRKRIMAVEHAVDASNQPAPRRVLKRTERSVSKLRKEQSGLGVDMDDDEEAHYRSARSSSRHPPAKRTRMDSAGRVVSNKHSHPRDKSGIRDEAQSVKIVKMARKAQLPMQREARKGESDRKIVCLKPKHLFSGKRGLGTNNRR